MKIRREWAMPSHKTFSINPIYAFVSYYLSKSKISIDPFAKNVNLATYTNDLNPGTTAQYHLPAHEFLEKMISEKIEPDLIFFDPPYSLRQLKECYENVGIKFNQQMSQSFHWGREKKLMDQLLKKDGVILSFGWNTSGMAKANGYGYATEEILLVCHGGAHNDTICMAERKTSEQMRLFN